MKIWKADWISPKLLTLSSIPTISLTPCPNLRKLSKKEKSPLPKSLNKINKRPLLSSSRRSTIIITRAKRILRKQKLRLLMPPLSKPRKRLPQVKTLRTHSTASRLKQMYMLSPSKNKEISTKKTNRN